MCNFPHFSFERKPNNDGQYIIKVEENRSFDVRTHSYSYVWLSVCVCVSHVSVSRTFACPSNSDL